MTLQQPKQDIGKFFVILGIVVFLLVAGMHRQLMVLNGVDFKTVYSSSKCLLDGCNPYSSSDLFEEYLKGHGDVSAASDLSAFRPYQALYPPSSLFWVIPFALLPWKSAVLLWVSLSGLLFGAATLLMADLCNEWTSPFPQILLGLFVATSTMLLTTAQPSGPAISLCVIGVWSLIRNRASIAGTLCFALSVALKPQIGGMVLIYFVLAPHARRKRAIATLLAAGVLALPGVVWAGNVPEAAHWLTDMRANLAGSSVRGSINDPGPSSYNSPMVIDLQSIVAVFDDSPDVYNRVSWTLVGGLLLPWAYTAWRAPASLKKDCLGVAAIACLSLLPIYHRHYDMRLLILTFPAVAVLLRGKRLAGVMSMIASLVTIGGSHPTFLRDHLHLQHESLAPLKKILLLHTSPLILFFSGLFYLFYFAQLLFQPASASTSTSLEDAAQSLEQTTLAAASGGL